MASQTGRAVLTIKKCATVVSIYQEEEEEEGEGPVHSGCGRTCLGPCCIPGARLPVYKCSKTENLGSIFDGTEDENCKVSFDSLVFSLWEDRMSKGFFRYDVTACETKMLPGELGFIAQLNEGRHLKKRPTEFRVDQVLQPFDPNKFNFTKVGQDEVLFCFEEGRDEHSVCNYFDKMNIDGNPNIIAINVSPIEYGHILLVPKISDCKPQQIDQESFRLAVYMACEADNPYFRVGYNSLGAFATINHLHFQAYYLAIPFPVERASVTFLQKEGGVKISELAEYPVKGLVFESSSSLDELSDIAAKSCLCLQARNIPFNVLIADCGQRIFLFPQCFAEKQALGKVDKDKLDTQVNPAVWEISGHIVLKRKEDYETASEEKAWSLLSEVSLSDDRFNEVKKRCVGLGSQSNVDLPKLLCCDTKKAFAEKASDASSNSQLSKKCVV